MSRKKLPTDFIKVQTNRRRNASRLHMFVFQKLQTKTTISIDTAPLTLEQIYAFVISIFLIFRLYLTPFTSGNFT